MKILKQEFYKIILFMIFILSLFSCVKNDKGIILDFYNYPNPFHPGDGSTVFKVVFDTTGISGFDWELIIYTEDYSIVHEASGSVTVIASPLNIAWNGRDNRGNVVKNGIYRAWITIKVTKTITGYSGNVYRADCYTVVK